MQLELCNPATETGIMLGIFVVMIISAMIIVSRTAKFIKKLFRGKDNEQKTGKTKKEIN